jgi:histidinol-phosphate aminotransferase
LRNAAPNCPIPTQCQSEPTRGTGPTDMKRRRFLRAGFTAGVAGFATPPFLSGSGSTSPVIPPRRTAEALRVPDPPLRLHHAENPRGLSGAARAAIVRELPGSSLYGSPDRTELTRRIAARHGVDTAFIALGNGSTDTLRQAAQAVGKPGIHLIAADPTYEDIFRYVRPMDPKITRVPLRADFSHDIPAMRRETSGGGFPALVYICQPNNPTGTLTQQQEIDAWIEAADEETVCFLVDEAFHYYVDDPGYRSADHWVHTKRNVIVARTFSKIYGLAGLRLGYGIAHPELALGMRNLWAGGVSHLTAVAALASMDDPDWMSDTIQLRDEARAITCGAMDQLGIEYIPTQTNFLMHRIKGDMTMHQERMLENGILVGREFPPMSEYSRVGLGLPESMSYFCETLGQFRDQGWI